MNPGDEHPADREHATLPHSLEAEKGLLSSMLLAPAEVCPAVEDLPGSAFYLPAHQTIHRLLLDLWRSEKPADVITLTQALRSLKELDAVGGPAFVTEIFTYVPTAANFRHYLSIVREKAALRAIIAADSTLKLAYRDGSDPEELAAQLDATAKEVRSLCVSDAFKPQTQKERVVEAIKGIEAIHERKGKPSGLETGFRDLDRLINGLNAPDMIVIAARPSMGKTALAMNIAENVAIAGHPVGIFSLEMSTAQLMQRMLCSRARVNLQKLRDGFLSERDFPNLTTAASKLAEVPMEIDDRSGMTVLDLRGSARQMRKTMGGLALIVIDYLQLLRSPSKRGQENRQIEISEISAGIKGLAKELHVPIVVLAQLNRNPESRSGAAKGRPRLSDLRESGSIEQDADTVALLMREEYYADTPEEKEEARGKATLIIAKNRHGAVDEIPLTFISQFTRFETRASDRSEQPAINQPHTYSHEQSWD